jgi:hypothetical protein
MATSGSSPFDTVLPHHSLILYYTTSQGQIARRDGDIEKWERFLYNIQTVPTQSQIFFCFFSKEKPVKLKKFKQ